jgi:hypothetical protein
LNVHESLEALRAKISLKRKVQYELILAGCRYVYSPLNATSMRRHDGLATLDLNINWRSVGAVEGVVLRHC